MDIQAITAQMTSFASHAIETSKTSILWLGHTIKIGFTTYALPTVDKASQVAAVAFSYLQNLLKSGPGFLFGIAGGILFIGITAFKLADRKDYEDNVVAKTAWKSVGIIAFISATALTSVGMAALVAG